MATRRDQDNYDYLLEDVWRNEDLAWDAKVDETIATMEILDERFQMKFIMWWVSHLDQFPRQVVIAIFDQVVFNLSRKDMWKLCHTLKNVRHGAVTLALESLGPSMQVKYWNVEGTINLCLGELIRRVEGKHQD